MIIGHQNILKFFGGATKHGRLAHAYCFVGASQVGKRTVARQIAAGLLDTPVEKLNSHPDFYYVERQEDEKTGKLKKELAIAQAREIRSRLQRTSWSGGYQVTIIDEAELLNDESANALLKTLEEPGAKSILFLLTEDEQRLLPTIRSRSQLCYFSLVSEQELTHGLVEQGVSNSEAKEVAELAWGRPGRALEMVQDITKKVWYLSEIQRFQKILGQPFYQKLELIEDIFGSAKEDERDSQRQRDQLQLVLDIWIAQWRKTLSGSSGIRSLRIIDQLFEAKLLLRQNIHPRLLLEQAVLQF